jgi:dihydropteroate synthase
MGVLNVTPDSFSDGNSYLDQRSAIDRAYQMVEEGADIIDVGGESTRPGAAEVSIEEEITRVKPVLEYICPRLRVPVSIDTYKREVAAMALDLGATLVNDISGLRGSPDLAGLVSRYNSGLVIMHMQGTPRNMQENPFYENVNVEILEFLRKKVLLAEDQGVNPDSIAIDPGIGFGKTVEHNLEILSDLEIYGSLGKPVLVGPSRKSFIGKILDKEVGDRVIGTAAVVAICVYSGVDFVRVHDIRIMKEVIQMADAIESFTGRRLNS